MKSTVASLAILKVTWDSLGKDYIESFLPFIATLITKNNYDFIDIHKVCNDFKEEYGLIIPYHPMITIINRAKQRGFIRKHHHKFIPIREKALDLDFSEMAREQEIKYNKVIDLFINYIRDNYMKYYDTLSKEEAEGFLLSFLKYHDIDILFASQQKSVLPEIESSIKYKFMVSSFIKYAYETNSEIFKFIVDIAIGYFLANAILYNEAKWLNSKLRNVHFYFDTRFILRLLGFEGEDRKLSYKDFILNLKEQGAKLYCFRHTFDEIMGILEVCLRRIGKKQDFTKVNPTLNFFITQGYKESDIERYISNIQRFFEENTIDIIDVPDHLRYQKHQIDEDNLKGFIIDSYKESNPYFKESERSFALQRDINSISAIYKLRKGSSPRNIREAGYIFITTNSTLAYASRKYEISSGDSNFIIPACVTDILIGTAIWLQSPAKVFQLNEKKLIADCYAALQPNNLLVKRLVNEVEKLKGEGRISEDEYYLLRTHRVVRDLLVEKTMGDADNFTDKTPEEILEEIHNRIRREEERRYKEELDNHKQSIEKLEIIAAEKHLFDKTILKRAEKLSKCIGKIFFIITVIITVSSIIIVTQSDNKLFYIALLISIITSIFNLGYGLNIKEIRDRIQGFIKNKAIQILEGKKL